MADRTDKGYDSRKVSETFERMLPGMMRQFSRMSGKKIPIPPKEQKAAAQAIAAAIPLAQTILSGMKIALERKDGSKRLRLSTGNGVVIVSEKPGRVNFQLSVDIRRKVAGVRATATPAPAADPLEVVYPSLRKRKKKS